MSSQFTKDKNKFIEVAEQLFEELCLAEQELKNPQEIKKKEDNKIDKDSQNSVNIAPPVYNEPPVDWDDSIPF